ncbi:transglutaminase domain-containing protein [Streptomyces coeruleoprunus]|uniref:Transglutaminase domain-containing protein n=1 Tax=Streptomyces coeruleoprunus TaxID=285563 RepID=A0ABV9XBR8_9ACTN
MTCLVLTPWWRRRTARTAPAAEEPGSCAATPILDLHHPRVTDLVAEARRLAGRDDARSVLAAAHRLIVRRVRPVYAMNDTQPVSRTLARGRGSCSQRLAVLEAVARALGVPTRVRGLVVDGSFWYPRFPRVRFLVPRDVVLAWPEFHLPGDAGWVGASELFGSLETLASRSPAGFTNRGSQTLFEALATTAVDWDGSLCASTGSCSAYDLSASVRTDLGRFPSRDALFTTHGQTLCPPARLVGDTLLGHRTAA